MTRHAGSFTCGAYEFFIHRRSACDAAAGSFEWRARIYVNLMRFCNCLGTPRKFDHTLIIFLFLSPHSFGVDASTLCSVILCSSGTTGMSKGTMLSSSQCLQMTRPMPQHFSAVLSFSSLYWLSGFTMLMFSLGNVCKRVITKRKFSPLLFVHLIERYKVNAVLTPPSQVAMLVQSPVLKLADLSSIRMYLVGGGFMPSHLRQAIQDHLLYGALIVTYGMTEIGGLISTTLPFQKPSNSVGKITPNMKLKVGESLSSIIDLNLEIFSDRR